MELVIAYLAINIAVGLVACFFGKKLFYLMLGLLVFLGVFGIATSNADSTALSFVIAVVLGVAAALLSKYVYKAGVFLVGFVAGAALGFILTMLLPSETGSFLWVIVLVAGLLVGLAAVRWSDLAIRLGTAWAGASFAVPSAVAAATAFPQMTELVVSGDANATFSALSKFIEGDFAAANGTMIFVGTLVLAVVGAVVQSRQKG